LGVSAVVLNVVAFLLVGGISWIAMMWLAGKVHSDGVGQDEEWAISTIHVGDPCPECSGVGAMQAFEGLQACGLCEGRGEITSLPG